MSEDITINSESDDGGPPSAVGASSAGNTRPDSGTRVEPRQFLESVLRLMGDEGAAVEITETEDAVKLNITGADRDALLANGGATLGALQLIVNRAKNRGDVEGKRVLIDTEGYRSGRADSLEGVAGELAKLAQGKGKPVAIFGMDAVDRRAVHMALKGDRAIATHSEGEGAYRKLVLMLRGEGNE